jgi:hypothetical protein
MKRFLLLLSLVLAPLVPIRHAIARSSSGITVSTTAHGVKLTLVVPRRDYARNALVQTRLVLSNDSSLAVRIPLFTHEYSLSEGARSLSSCQWQNPAVEVESVQGRQVYPPSVPLVSPCLPYQGGGSGTSSETRLGIGAGGHLTVQPYSTYTWRPIVILWRRFVRGAILLALNNATGTPLTVKTPRIALQLASGHPPLTERCATLTCVHVIPRPSWVHHGPLYFSSSTDCRGSIRYDTWRSRTGNTVYPPCPNPAAWHVAVGYLNHPSATVYFKSP